MILSVIHFELPIEQWLLLAFKPPEYGSRVEYCRMPCVAKNQILYRWIKFAQVGPKLPLGGTHNHERL